MSGPRGASHHPSLFLGFLCLLSLLCFLGLSFLLGQQPPADAAEISRELLYDPARRMEWSDRDTIFRATKFTYRFHAEEDRWEVVPEKNADAGSRQALKSYANVRLGLELRFHGMASQDEGVLEIRRGDQTEPVARLALWNRERLAKVWFGPMRQANPGLTEEDLARDLEIAEPEVAGVADDGASLWLAIEHYAGEGWLGIGTLVHFNPESNQAKVYQPEKLATSSITHVAWAGGALWLGTHRQGEGTIQATAGLVRFDPATSELRSYLPANSALPGQIVTALAGRADSLWVAMDAGFCGIHLPALPPATTPSALDKDGWACWRLIPTVHLAVPTPVSNRPGGRPRGRLAAGDYEVRWANYGFLEVITQEAIEGWIASDDFEEYARLGFSAEPFELANTYGGGAPVMRLLDKPEGDPLAAAQAYRAPLDRVGSPAAGWQRVRARVGWISRGSLPVAPRIQAVAR